ncbi:hypothetical protein SCV69_07720 [Legionella pneumophila serogroup 1]|uniref:hypothetical protein n=1 Tax=Legionella pneumophila TaxID=446 RepID=UPI0007708B3D|nr:hypothetical protein [Legionella pneumophila]HAT8874856.1 hypothetical protein [Legionella pneumophila subsp. pneumophila]CZG51792.1 Uncharacterised protein [Legionella pneumophila]CZG65853.1 Uncharacterised protein [Legionella pneumophila]HAT8948520.1 hypothetical protein [Legionella pneumophila subsp. pneumophila]HAT9144249.1 hypothetical protein [Legionella pneumophila subsp. pneumophila]
MKDKNQSVVDDVIPYDPTDQDSFSRQIVAKNILASMITEENFVELGIIKDLSYQAIKALGVKSGLQAMLVSQMLSIHELQQKALQYANNTQHYSVKERYISSAVKLSNCFANQVNVLTKLQDNDYSNRILEKMNCSF